MKNYEKWNQYKVGKIEWINKRRQHPHRQWFVDYIIDNASSVLEIGPGELIEYQKIKEQKKIEYAIVDVSDLFLKNCSSKFPEVKTFQLPMEDLSLEKIGKLYDIVYVASVLEHSRNIKLALRSLMSVAKRFHFVMFKWSYGGSLESVYIKKKKYWSTSFSIYELMKEINQVGQIDRCFVMKKNGEIVSFENYSRGRTGECRTGDYLIISGVCK